MPFEYNWTCPIVDMGIDGLDFKEYLKPLSEKIIETVEEEGCILESELEEIFDEINDELDDHVTNQFEEVRSSNIDMRSSAERQISDVEDELEFAKNYGEEKESEIEELQNTIKEKDTEIEELNERITKLEEELNSLEEV